jgi:molybdopterin-guanine dinucleotide biosynthesis protein A
MTSEPVEPFTGIVLAGGKSTRFGSDKASAMLLGRPLLEWVVDALAIAPGGTVVVRARRQSLPVLPGRADLRVTDDLYEAKGPLAGIVTGFRAVATPLALVISCDAPLVRPELVLAMAQAAEGHDVVLPHANGYPQPLLAMYRVGTCLEPFTEAVERDDLKITRAYAGLHVKVLREDELRAYDPQLLSFRNTNTPEALAALESAGKGLLGT